jgi:hypothetical protein
MMPLAALPVASFNHFHFKTSLYRALGSVPAQKVTKGAGQNTVRDDSAVVSVLFSRTLMMMRNTAAR